MKVTEGVFLVIVLMVLMALFYGLIQLNIEDNKETRKNFIQCTQKTKDVTWCYDKIK